MRYVAGLTTTILTAAAMFAFQVVSIAQDSECGMSPNAWCPAPAGDPMRKTSKRKRVQE